MLYCELGYAYTPMIAEMVFAVDGTFLIVTVPLQARSSGKLVVMVLLPVVDAVRKVMVG